MVLKVGQKDKLKYILDPYSRWRVVISLFYFITNNNKRRYREVCDPGYDFVSAQPGNAGHFSQVVWKGSTRFGIGRAAEMRNGLLCTYIVARYRPAGNFLGMCCEGLIFFFKSCQMIRYFLYLHYIFKFSF